MALFSVSNRRFSELTQPELDVAMGDAVIFYRLYHRPSQASQRCVVFMYFFPFIIFSCNRV